MAELSHNTTIGGFRVLYEGMENPILLNTLTINADLVVSGSILGNAQTQSKLQTARTISLTGGVTGSQSFDGSQNVSIAQTVANDSHTHDGRYFTETEADGRFVYKAGDTMTGSLTVNGSITEGGTLLSNKYAQKSHTHPNATTSASGFMSNTDKTKLDAVNTFINNIVQFPISLWSFTGHTNTVFALAYGDGYLYSGSYDKSVRKINPATGTEVWSFTGHTGAVRALAYGDGYLYSGSNDRSVRKINPATGTEVWSFTGHTDYVFALVYGSDGYLYSGSFDKTVKKIDPATAEEVWTFTGHTNNVVALAYGSDGYLYSGSYDKTVKKIDPATAEEVWTFTGHTDDVVALAYGSDGYLYSGSYDNTVKKIETNGSFPGNQKTQSKLQVARTISLTGGVTGSQSFDGSQNVSIAAVVADDSHTHDTRYFTETEADGRFVKKAGDTMTGNLTVNGTFTAGKLILKQQAQSYTGTNGEMWIVL